MEKHGAQLHTLTANNVTSDATIESMEQQPEPWLRGPLPDVHSLLAPLLYSLEHAREDLIRHTDGLTVAQVWSSAHGVPPVGFQLKHIAGSVERLLAYLEGRELTEAEMAALKAEKEPGASRADLLAALDAAFAKAGRVVRALDPARLAEPREVGRRRLPTTAIGLLTHIAEHTQRHVGEAICAARLARAGVF